MPGLLRSADVLKPEPAIRIFPFALEHMLSIMNDITFLDPGELVDGELELVPEAQLPADPEQVALPVYQFAMRKAGSDEKIGEIGLRIGTPLSHKGHLWYRVQQAISYETV